MKFSVVFLMVSMLVCYGCASSPIQQYDQKDRISTGDQARLDREEALKRKAEEARIAEEDLRARQERERLLQEKISTAPATDIYFEYDSYAVRSDDLSRLKEIGDWLKSNRDIPVILEGHCDERGTIEYNLALGQKRAEAVRNHLANLGVEEKRMRVISYGKEMPADHGHTEEAWAKNRRVHFAFDRQKEVDR
ncbi:peptidoglycan-associated lipoprotein Pal [Syntrophorhabdus aromaticivorans]|uniref:Peptidoglycan-associated protein n=1 Tax=Syntrophorhabdus aromaticivorans TaxID=328301 RepID=A0A351U5Y1_9BACT|nr:peptidoglycan-associated lipoprotein Pal [Syntrophorhabdus aromaticivorans]NLW34605.1 peptidoglycan-associated lipoprotein Pal [Syntrophorhabdus aromaticivorans]HBA55362.1 peptidoglycan-associated lipoprotein Pal [Syntrophorhabdus aromaticivorans]